jgi:phosphoribosylanthranilate isomerase
MPHVKICCISSHEEARTAIAAGAHALGLVSDMPSGPGVIGEDLIASIAQAIPPPTQTFLLTRLQTAYSVMEQHQRCRTTTVQLVDALPEEELAELRHLLPSVRLVQVIHVQDEASIDEAVAAAPWVDALLLDSGRPNAPVPELGGTGRTHDWALSARIRQAVGRTPLYLAGGLRPDNVAEAIAAVRPYGLDLCSGVRTDGRLDAAKLDAFMAAVRAARAANAS